MNKRLRFITKMLKYRKRLKQLNISDENGNIYSYRSHGKPCSCGICRNPKYSRKVKHKNLK